MNHNMDDGSDELLPLSPATKERIKRDRMRSDKISSLMGQYLLSGWRMLNEYCTVCQTILLMRPAGDEYCIACCELDKSDSPKNNVCKPICETEVPSCKTSNHSGGDDGWSVINKPGSKGSSHHAEDVSPSEIKPMHNGQPAANLPLIRTSSRRIMASILSKLTFSVDHFEAAISPQDIKQWALAIRTLIETADAVSKSSIPDTLYEQ